MFNFLKKLFSEKESNKDDTSFEGNNLYSTTENIKKYSLGATPSEPDVRTIDIAQVSAPVELPAEYETDLSGFDIFNQGFLGTCVAHALVLVKMVLDSTQKIYSRRFLYVLTRRFTGMNDSEIQGLSPTSAVKALSVVGVINERGDDNNFLVHTQYVNDYEITPDMRKEANINRANGYGIVQVNEMSMKQAIFKHKVIPVTIGIDWGAIDNDGTVHAPVKLVGLHEVVFCGWSIYKGKLRFKFRNSWGVTWGSFGYGYVYATELDKVVYEALAVADVPNDLVERAKSYQYLFLADFGVGAKGDAVSQLQKRLIEYKLLDISEPTAYFGQQTFTALVQYQKLRGIQTTGFFGPLTREAMNEDVAKGKVKAKFDLWMQAIIKMEDANPKYNNPGNIRYIGQAKAIGKAGNGMCIFPDYATGYMELRNLLVRAATGQSSNYKPDQTIYEFYEGVRMPNRFGKEIFGYAPDSDGNDSSNYANFVAKTIGVPVTTKIKDLL